MRRTSIATLLLAFVLITLTGCGDNHDKLANDMVGTLEDYNEILADVKDADSAKDAGPKLRKLADRIKDINERKLELGDPDAETQAAIEEKYKARFENIQKDMMANMFRIMSLGDDVQAELEKAMEEMEDGSSPGWF